MKFTPSTLLLAAATLSGLAIAVPEPAHLNQRYVRNKCREDGGTWDSCEYPDYYLKCNKGNPSLYTCDGGCQASGCDWNNAACTPVPKCDNPKPCAFPPK
ncbi:hypothetical protein F4806DRAFT_492431 [Annulohypoxylon nitens]|nr:hypothetical protein F4806DRAFT_492431 [Annulohypoxylon nitens]